MPIGTAHWVADGMVRSLRRVGADHATRPGFAVDVVNQFFHAGRPLGWMRSFSLAIDSEAVDPSQVTFELHGQTIPAAILPEIDEIWWQPRDIATLTVRGIELSPGRHRLTWTFDLPLVNFTPIVDHDNIYPTFQTCIDVELVLDAEEA